MSQELVWLACGAFELDLCPRLGGTISGFRHQGLDLMRPPGARFLGAGDPGEASCFPLVPFSNRIADAGFRFRGEVYELPRNFPPEPHAIHGQGWQHPWTAAAASASRAELTFRHAVPGTPLDYHARQLFELDDDGLSVTIAVTNGGERPMPAGVGLHPYFARTAGVTLTASLDHVWLADERKIPKERVPLPAHWDFSKAPRVAALQMDNCFGGWDGHAQIHWPETRLTLTIESDPGLGHLVIYIPPGADFFSVEAVSNANDGFNLMARGVDGTGVRVLEPGETLSGTVRFGVRAGS
jgi:aldose 1-epimerase